MRIDFLTLFPDMFTGMMNQSIWKQATDKKLITYHVTDFRMFSEHKHKKVDDYPYGGGAGMVLSPQPLFDAVESLPKKNSYRIILLCPQGKPFNQSEAERLAKEEQLIMICGHYEGYDERIRSHLATDEYSIGDYILTGGELGAMVIADSITRLVPGVLGNDASAISDSFSTGLLEYPQYTRPQNFRGLKVPDVLLSGHHEKIDKWRRKEQLKRTKERRPDLLKEIELTEREKHWLEDN